MPLDTPGMSHRRSSARALRHSGTLVGGSAPDLNATHRDKCKQLLKNPEQACIDLQFENIFVYKNKPIASCTVLHYAVFRASQDGDEGDLRRVLECRADVHAKARYIVPSGHVELEAVHVAAGLGCLRAMKLLVAWVCEDDTVKTIQYLQTPTTISKKSANTEQTPTMKTATTEQTINYYYPIHDAMYQGQKEMVLWLLQMNVDATMANKDGSTALHFLALVGGQSPLDQKADVEEVVRSLLESKASLEAKTNGKVEPHPAPATLQEKIPLEVAADTQYPKKLLHLLAPSASMEGNASRIFDDLLLLSTRNMKVTEELTKQILSQRWEDDAYKLGFWREAQHPVHVDHLANLLYTVPQAAVNVLDMLIGEPIPQEPQKHPIPSQMTLPSGSMRCTYQRDHMKISSDWTPRDHEDDEDQADIFKWPLWKFSGTAGKGEAWHEAFLPIGNKKAQDKVYDVETKVVLLANILDVDIFMALTQCGYNHVFTKLPVQGVIYCLWDNLVFDVFRSSLVFDVLELVVLAWWGLDTVGGVRIAPPPWYPACWSLLFAGFFREFINLLWWFMAHWSKWATHTNPAMKSMWDPWALLIDSWFWSTLFMLLIRLAFLVVVWKTRENPVMSFNAEALLAWNAFLQGFRVTYMLRLLDNFKSILAIFKTFFSGAIREMLLIAWMLFASFALAFLMLNHAPSWGWTLTYLYRGLMFGDGDGLEKLGLGYTSSDSVNEEDVKDYSRSSESQAFSRIFMAFGSCLFSIAILNLTQAIYTNEYDEIEQDTHLLFLKERAKYCLVYVEMMHKQRVVDTLKALCSGDSGGMKTAVWLLDRLGVSRALALCMRAYECMMGFLFEQRRASAAACVAWVLMHPLRSHFPVLLGLLFGCLQISWQARLVQADWFQPDSPEEPSDNLGFLWICHSADFEESQLSAKEEAGNLQARLGRLEEKVDHLSALIEHRLLPAVLGRPPDRPDGPDLIRRQSG